MAVKLFHIHVLVLFLCFLSFRVINASEGDRSLFYLKCIKNCVATSCTADGQRFEEHVKKQLDFMVQLLWNCQDDCKYNCMWLTVEGFEKRGYNIPKFHGKWPFKRLLGVQEPASALASILNLLAHVYMIRKLINQFPPKYVPQVWFWIIFAGVCIHAWAWSTIFHTRDNFFTEFMDYSCALSMVMALFVAAIMRVLRRRTRVRMLVLGLSILFYFQHVVYLYSGRVDYDYNMFVNVFFGGLGSLAWLVCSCGLYLSGARYAWRMIVFTNASGAALTLEMIDFPPLLSVLDAHALWHFSTAALPLLFYRFVIDDLKTKQGTVSWAKEKGDLKLT